MKLPRAINTCTNERSQNARFPPPTRCCEQHGELCNHHAERAKKQRFSMHCAMGDSAGKHAPSVCRRLIMHLCLRWLKVKIEPINFLRKARKVRKARKPFDFLYAKKHEKNTKKTQKHASLGRHVFQAKPRSPGALAGRGGPTATQEGRTKCVGFDSHCA